MLIFSLLEKILKSKACSFITFINCAGTSGAGGPEGHAPRTLYAPPPVAGDTNTAEGGMPEGPPWCLHRADAPPGGLS